MLNIKLSDRLHLFAHTVVYFIIVLGAEVSAAPPDAPTNITTTLDNQGRLTISWMDQSNDEEGYYLERRSDEAGSIWSPVGTTGVQNGASSFIDSTLIVDDHAAIEHQYRIQAYRGTDVSSFASNWAVNCSAVPADPEQQWLSQLPTQSGQAIWDTSLPVPSAQTQIDGWNLSGGICSMDLDSHFPCDYVMLSNDKYAALFIAGNVPMGGTGGAVNAGGLVGLTHRNYGMEFSGWDGVKNQHIWELTLATEDDLVNKTILRGGFQQSSLSSVTQQLIGGEVTLVFEWNLPQGQTVKTFWNLQSFGSPGLHGRLEVTGTYNDGGDIKGLVSVKFPKIGSLGFSTTEPVNLIWPSRGHGIRIKDFKNTLNRKYMSTGLEAQFFGLEKGSYGLYISTEDVDLHSKEMRVQTNIVNAGTEVTYFPYDGAGRAGNEVTHAQIVLTPLCGDWRRIGKRYRRFVLDHRQADPAGSWISKGTIDVRTDIPETIKRSVYWWNENMGPWSAEAGRQSINFLKRLLLDGTQGLAEFNNPPQVLPDFTNPVFPDGPPLGIHLYNWYEIPGAVPSFDIGLPSYPAKINMSDAIASMQSEQQNTTLVVPYINATNVDITNDVFGHLDELGNPTDWGPFVQRDENTTSPFIVGSATGRDLAKVAINTQVWRDTVNTITDNVLGMGTSGLTGIYLDTFGAANSPDYDVNQTGRDTILPQWIKSGETNSPRRGYGPWIASSNQQLASEVKDKTALKPGAFVTAEHFSEAFIDDLDMVFLYTSFGTSLPLNRSAGNGPDETKTEFIGLISTVYSDYQIFAGYRSSYLDSVRAAAMKHGYGFALGTHVGLNSRSAIGDKRNVESLPLTICKTGTSSTFDWVVYLRDSCPPKIAYMNHLAQARFALQNIFRGEYLGPAEDISAVAELNEYWCRGSTCQPPKIPDGSGGMMNPITDICSEGGSPELAECANRYFPVNAPAIRGGTWVAPTGEKALVLTNTDNVPRSGSIPIPNSWQTEFTTARLCPANNPTDASGCIDINMATGIIPVTDLPAFSAWYIYGCTSDLGTTPVLITMQDADGDTVVNGCDTDDDGDGLLDSEEAIIGTDALLADTDGDGISDYNEVNYDGIPGIYTPGQDLDPLSSDTDTDGLADGADPLPLAFHFNDGDVAPLGLPDGQVNVGDLLIMKRIILGDIPASNIELVHGDLYPVGAPDGVIDISDLLLHQQLILQ